MERGKGEDSGGDWGREGRTGGEGVGGGNPGWRITAKRERGSRCSVEGRFLAVKSCERGITATGIVLVVKVVMVVARCKLYASSVRGFDHSTRNCKPYR